ncbi:hypothetical protein [Mesorhizobium sp. B4-1-4]|uniref:hypothetical protein n=1 Tax=Mesorhizobium sp. B4-1-4 TaxID=2589888 RepID=UPI0011265683|nr:hypothetical protein [Mesorhizobium sp. B4-1-4]UCI34397.1 hypothetical protein FJW03_13665 [Mesorhizobium sp. B4-1-4]
MSHRSIIIKTGHGPGTAVAVLTVGLVVVGIVFLVLGGARYFGEQPSNQHALSSVPARSVQTADRAAEN